MFLANIYHETGLTVIEEDPRAAVGLLRPQ